MVVNSHFIPSLIPHGPTFIPSYVHLLYTHADSHLPDPHKLLLLCHVADSEQGEHQMSVEVVPPPPFPRQLFGLGIHC